MVSGAGRMQGAGQVFLTNHPQRAAEGEEWGLAGKIDIPSQPRLEKRRLGLRGEFRTAKITLLICLQ